MLKVKLVHDYTKYNEKLEKGIEGLAYETPEEQEMRKSDDHFVKVKFEGITEVDVLWRGLEIIDEPYLAEKQRIKDEYFAQMTTAKNVVYTLGPKGGFKTLELDFVDKGEEVHKVIEDKEVGQDYLTALEKFNISIKVVQLEKKIPERKKKNA